MNIFPFHFMNGQNIVAKKDAPPDQNIVARIRLIILSRLFIVTFILGIHAYAELGEEGGLFQIPVSIFSLTVLFTYLSSAIFVYLFYHNRNAIVNIYSQSIIDLIVITSVIYATGGINSIYSVFYPLVVIYAVIFLEKKGGLLIASAASLLYGLSAVLEYYGLIHPIFSSHFSGYRLDAGYVMARVVTHAVSFYLTAFLSSYVVGQERKARALLAEKQDAFTQLDILYKSMIESVNAGIVTINLEGRIKSFNRAASAITGHSFKNVENRKFSTIFPDFHDYLEEQKKQMGRDSDLPHFEGVFHTTKNREMKLGASLSRLKDQRGNVIGDIIIFEDISEIMEMRESLEKNRRMAFTGEVAANLAHEIRNPLAAIGGSIQLLKKDIPLEHGNQRLFEIILRGKEQLETFLRDFLLLARPAPGVCEDVDLNEVIHEVIDSLRLLPDWPESLGIRLELPPQRFMVKVNKTELRQVLWNLSANALQAMPEGGLMVMQARKLFFQEIAFAEIVIKDSGVGIEKSDLQKIFDPFFTTRSVGTGLGLAVVNRIIENWKGNIRVSSESGHGTTFTITFPIEVLYCKR